MASCAPDCQERADCAKVGGPGHYQCGMCPDHEMPRHHCGCLVVMEPEETGADRIEREVADAAGLAPMPRGHSVEPQRGDPSDLFPSWGAVGSLEWALHYAQHYSMFGQEPESQAALTVLARQMGLILEAWDNEGPAPLYHREIKDWVRRNWPTLYRAIERAR